MVTEEEVRSFAQEIGNRFHPEKVILFGSHSYGTPSEDSDVDLLVIMQHQGHPARQALEIRRTIRRFFPLDLIVQSPADISRRLKAGDPFITESVNCGHILYSSD